MDVDAFAAEHGPEWHRLRTLLARPRRKRTAADIDEMVMLYRRTATHLSIVQSRSPDPELVTMLTRLVLRARAAVTPSTGMRWSEVGRFFTVTFPLEVYRAARWWVGAATAFVLLSVVLIVMVANDLDIARHFMTAAEMRALVERDFEAYYSSAPAQNFGLQVWTNNAWVCGVCLASGVLILPVLYVLWQNAFNLGIVGGVMVGHDRTDQFLGLLLVHGMLELTCIFIAAGVGLRIGWSWIAPGPWRTRGQAVATAGRSGLAVALGLVPVLLVSGILESFVTPAPFPAAFKLMVGGTVWLAFLGYVTVAGWRAQQAGLSADVDAADREAVAPTV